MKTLKKLFVLAIFILTACGPSKEELEHQRIQDSIELEADRIKVLERANTLLNPANQNNTKEEENESITD